MTKRRSVGMADNAIMQASRRCYPLQTLALPADPRYRKIEMVAAAADPLKYRPELADNERAVVKAVVIASFRIPEVA